MSKNSHIRFVAGENLRHCLKSAQKLGCTVEVVHRTGEIRCSHPTVPESVRVDRRRKSSPRALTCWLNHLVEALAGAAFRGQSDR